MNASIDQVSVLLRREDLRAASQILSELEGPSHDIDYAKLRIDLYRNGASKVLPKAEEMLKRYPESVEFKAFLCRLLMRVKRRDDARVYLEQLEGVQSSNPYYWYDLAIIFDIGSNTVGARACYNKAVLLDPEWREVLNARGRFRMSSGDSHLAIRDFYRVLSVNPDSDDVFYYLASCYYNLGELEKSTDFASIARSVGIYADDVQLLEAFLDIKAGRLGEGFRKYRVRRKTFERLLKVELDSETPDWYGEDLTGKTIAVNEEQGLGDVLNFVRYLPALHQKAGKIVVLCRRPLLGILEHSFPEIDFVTSVKDVPQTDFKTLLMDLPEYLSPEIKDVPSSEGYIQPTEAAVEFWKSHLPNEGKPLVGIVWSGNPDNSRDVLRSIPIDHVKRILGREDVTFVNLQKDGPSIEGIWHPNEHLTDLDRTGGLISHLDLFITADTGPAHLAGAMGVPTWMMIDRGADWRWQNGKETTYWYDSVRLFQQTKYRVWDDVIDRVIKALDERYA